MSTQWYKVEVFNLKFDLAPLLQSLQQKGVACRVTEEPDGQWLWVDEEDTALSLKTWLANQTMDFQSPPPSNMRMEQSSNHHVQAGSNFTLRKLIEFSRLLRVFPITLFTIFFGILGALLIQYDQQMKVVSLLTFQPMQVMGDKIGLASVFYGMELHQYWRLITPIFLHFGIFHILFNGLWIWEFGRRIEFRFGGSFLVLSILGIAIVSNGAQYWWEGPSLFGGLSGVLYGLLGFLWIHHKQVPHPTTALPPGIIGFMLFWLALCMSGAINMFIDGSIANAAHVGGLLAGMLWAVLYARFKKTRELS